MVLSARAVSYTHLHEEFMRGHVTIIGCPKLDAVDYSEKLTEIIRSNDIKSVTVLRMELSERKRGGGSNRRGAVSELRQKNFRNWKAHHR